MTDTQVLSETAKGVILSYKESLISADDAYVLLTSLGYRTNDLTLVREALKILTEGGTEGNTLGARYRQQFRIAEDALETARLGKFGIPGYVDKIGTGDLWYEDEDETRERAKFERLTILTDAVTISGSMTEAAVEEMDYYEWITNALGKFEAEGGVLTGQGYEKGDWTIAGPKALNLYMDNGSMAPLIKKDFALAAAMMFADG